MTDKEEQEAFQWIMIGIFLSNQEEHGDLKPSDFISKEPRRFIEDVLRAIKYRFKSPCLYGMVQLAFNNESTVDVITSKNVQAVFREALESMAGQYWERQGINSIYNEARDMLSEGIVLTKDDLDGVWLELDDRIKRRRESADKGLLREPQQ